MDDEKLTNEFKVNDRIKTYDGRSGTIKYIGNVIELGNDIYAGIELDIKGTLYYMIIMYYNIKLIFIYLIDDDDGNDGSINNNKYFDTTNKHGIFLELNKIYLTGIDYYNEPKKIIDTKNIDTNDVSRKLSKKMKRRPSMTDVELQGVVPPNYFKDPVILLLLYYIIYYVILYYIN